jgi:hypothetical protein
MLHDDKFYKISITGVVKLNKLYSYNTGRESQLTEAKATKPVKYYKR